MLLKFVIKWWSFSRILFYHTIILCSWIPLATSGIKFNQICVRNRSFELHFFLMSVVQDLLKYTPSDHHDRINLQMALTELENLTHKLNETKRDSEMRYEAKKIVANLIGRNSIKSDDKRYLVRNEDVVYLVNLYQFCCFLFWIFSSSFKYYL